MQLDQATAIAERVKTQLAPHCDRIEIAGSIRRRKPDVGDIEIVAIPKPYDVGLFASGIAPIVSAWPKVRGELPCKYTQRTLPDGIALDLFFATRENWGAILLIRTGDSEFSKYMMGWALPAKGYQQKDGYVWKDDRKIPALEENDVFDFAGLPFIDPVCRVGRPRK